MTKKKMTLCILCVFALGIGVALIVAHSVAHDNSRVSRSIYKQLHTQMQKTGEIPKTVKLADYTDFDWDELLVYDLRTVNDVEAEFGIKLRIKQKDYFVQGVIFYNDNNAVHNECYTFNFDQIPKEKIAIYPAKRSNGTRQTVHLKKDQAIFETNYLARDIFQLFPLESKTGAK